MDGINELINGNRDGKAKACLCSAAGWKRCSICCRNQVARNLKTQAGKFHQNQMRSLRRLHGGFADWVFLQTRTEPRLVHTSPEHQGHTSIVEAAEIIPYRTEGQRAHNKAQILDTQVLSMHAGTQLYLVTLWFSAQNAEPLSLVGDTVKTRLVEQNK